jgi:hypothetical protein
MPEKQAVRATDRGRRRRLPVSHAALRWAADAAARHHRPLPVELRVVPGDAGEALGAQALADRLQQQLGWCAVLPRYGERVRLD